MKIDVLGEKYGYFMSHKYINCEVRTFRKVKTLNSYNDNC